MITDSLLQLSTAQVLTGITDTNALSTNTIPLTVARDMGEGAPLYGHFVLTVAVTNGTSTQFEIIAASDEGLTSDIMVLGSTGAIPTAQLTLGKELAVTLRPLMGQLGQKYIGARYTVVGTNNAGKVTAQITNQIADGKKFYAANQMM